MQKIFFITVFSLFSQISSAYIGAVSTATGGAGRGAIESVDGLYLNPAFIRDFAAKSFSFNYSKDQWALSLIDTGADAFFPAGLQFISQKTDIVDTQKLGLTLGAPRWNRIVLGGTLAMLEYTDNLATTQDRKFRQGALDLGLTFSLYKNLSVGLVANKVGATEVDLNESLQQQKTLGLGISYMYDDFARFRLDAESGPDNKTDRLIYMVGVENYINDWVIFRLGFQNNQVLAKDYFTAGLGFAGPQFTLHYAYISDTVDQTDQKHLFDLGIPF